MSTDQSRKQKAKKQHDVYRDEPMFPHKTLRFTLPIAPSVNHMYHNTRYGGKILTRKAQDYVRVSRALINVAIEEQMWVKQEDAVWFYIDMVFYMPDRIIRDSHNMQKILLDVMQGIIFENDYYALPRVQSVEYDKENPRIEVVISPQLASHRERGLVMTQVK